MDRMAELNASLPGRCLFDEPLAAYTTFRIGGRAQCLVQPASAEEWAKLYGFVRHRSLPWTVLGLGSNVIVSDQGLKGVTACTRGMARVEVSGSRLRAEAGAALDAVVEASVAAGLGGMEKLSGIPGSVGGAVWMNAGAFGQETFDQLVSLGVLDRDGVVRRLSKGKLKPGYRKVEGLDDRIILSAEWALSSENPAVLREAREATLKARADKQPLEHPSAGSVFKRPPGDYASRLIDSCGLKGLTVGGAQVSPKHAGFIVNLGRATARDVMELIAKVREEVKKKTGVALELEQIPLGFEEGKS